MGQLSANSAVVVLSSAAGKRVSDAKMSCGGGGGAGGWSGVIRRATGATLALPASGSRHWYSAALSTNKLHREKVEIASQDRQSRELRVFENRLSSCKNILI